MNAIGHPEIPYVNIIKSARVGYTQMLRAAVGYFTAHKGRNQILYQPTDTHAQNFMKSHAEPMVRDVPVVRALAPWLGKKHRDSTLSTKRFSNGKQLWVLGGTAASNYREKSADNVFYDELSKFLDDIEKEGSPTFLGDKRLEGSAFPKSVRGSTPGIEPDEEGKGCQITVAAREAECFFKFHLPCPHCDQEQVLKFGGKDCDYGLKWVDDNPKSARYLCEHCQTLIDNNQLRAMQERGVWRCENTGTYTVDGIEYFSEDGKLREPPESVSFHIWTILSLFTTWASIVRDFLKTKGNRSKLKSFVNTTLGETWQDDEAEQLEHEQLYARREHYAEEIPVVRCIPTVAVDVQDDRFEVEHVGWVAGEESFRISYKRLYGDLSRSEIWKVLHKEVTRKFKLLDGTLIEPRLCLIDSGGHYTDEVYKFCKKHGVRKYIPIKGHHQTGKPIASFPRKKNDKGVYLTMIGTDTAKELINDRLRQLEVGEGYMHYPVSDEFDADYFKHLCNEKRLLKLVRGRWVWIWDAGGRRNEPLDTSVYNLAGIRILQQHAGVVLPEKCFEIDNYIEPDPAPATKQRRVRSRGLRH